MVNLWNLSMSNTLWEGVIIIVAIYTYDITNSHMTSHIKSCDQVMSQSMSCDIKSCDPVHVPNLGDDTFEEIWPLIGHSTHQQTTIGPSLNGQPAHTHNTTTTDSVIQATMNDEWNWKLSRGNMHIEWYIDKLQTSSRICIMCINLLLEGIQFQNCQMLWVNFPVTTSCGMDEI